MLKAKCPRCGSTDREFYLAPCNDDYWTKGADDFHVSAALGRGYATISKQMPPTAASIVSWCHGENSEWIVKGVQHMLDRYVETCGLAEDHKKMCGRLREYCEWRHIGLGGEHLDELVLARARQLESMIARLRGLLYRWYESKTLADTLLSESALLMPQLTKGKEQESGRDPVVTSSGDGS